MHFFYHGKFYENNQNGYKGMECLFMNKLKSKMLLILSILLLFTIIGAASASPDNTIIGNDNVNNEILTQTYSVGEADTASADNNVKLNNGAGSNTLGADSKSFSDLNNTIANNTFVELTENYAYNEATDSGFYDGILISTSNFILNGNGHTIDAKGSNKVFNFNNASNVIIENLTVINSGSILYITNSNSNGNLTLSGTFISAGNQNIAVRVEDFGHVSLIGNFSNFLASGVGDGAVLVFKNCQNGVTLKGNFINNTATKYGGVAYVGWNGATSRGDLIFEGNFINNTANIWGGVFTMYDSLVGNIIINGNFINNKVNGETSGGEGGIFTIYKKITGNVTINGNFTDNTAVQGGIVYFRDVVDGNVIFNANCTNNHASDGGILMFKNTLTGSLDIDGDFVNNTADMGSVFVIANVGSADIKGNYINNTAGENIIDMTSTKNSKVSGNFINNTASPIIKSNNDVDLSESNFSDNNGIIISLTHPLIWTNYAPVSNVNLDITVTLPKGNARYNIKNSADETVEKGIITVTEGIGTEIITLPVGEYTITLINDKYRDEEYQLSSSETVYHVTIAENFENLKNTIESGTGTIDLNPHYLYDGNTSFDGINLKANIIIDGHGTIIDANNLARIFNIPSTASNVVIKNIIFENGYSAANGGAILSQTTFTLINCTFINNNAVNGGAIYTNGLTVENSTFTQNTATAGYGGAIYQNSASNALNVNNTIFTENEATLNGHVYGGAIYIAGNAAGLINNSQFTANKVTEVTTASRNAYGSAVYINQNRLNVEVHNSIFNDNVATAVTANYARAALAGQYVNVYNSTFTNNIGTNGYGGAVSTMGKYASVIDNCTFINNSARYGGAIYTSDNRNLVSVNNSNFINNTATVEGGAIYSNGIKLNKSNFTENSAVTGGGAIFVNGNTNKYSIIDEVICNNNKATNGGAIYITSNSASNSLITNITLTNNTAADGSGICIADYYNKIINANLTNNYISTRLTYLNHLNVSDMINVTVDGEDAFKDLRSLDAIVDNSTFFIPEDYGFSNPIIINASNVIIDGKGKTYNAKNSQFFIINGNNITLKNITLVNGTGYDGGAIYWNGDNGKIEDATFINNTASHYGGAIYNTKPLNITNSIFIGNYAANERGGAIYGLNETYIANSKFENNSAKTYGGAIFLGSNTYSNLTIINSTFKNHNVGSNGGAIYSYYKTILIDSTFDNNTAGTHGSALMAAGANTRLFVDNCNFTNNKAGQRGAVYTDNRLSQISVENSNFINNTAQHGAGVMTYSDILEIKNSTFRNNTVTSNGGGLWMGINNTANLDNVQFINNTANNGGGIYYYSYGNNNDTLNNLTMIDNHALNTGAAIYTERSGVDINITDATLINNAGNKYGDAIYFSGPTNATLNDVSITGGSIQGAESFYNEFSSDMFNNVTIDGKNPLQVYEDVENLAEGSTYVLPDDFQFEYGPLVVNTSNVIIDGNGLNVDGKSARTFFRILANDVTLENMVLANAMKVGNGGAVMVTGNGTTIKNMTFIHCNATGNGGAIYWTGSDGTVENSTFIDNIASSGGAIYWTGPNAVVKNDSNFINNVAINDGGAIYFTGANSNVNNSIFINNSAGYNNKRGGAIRFSGMNNTVSDCSFINNSAGQASAIDNTYNNADNTLRIYDSEFIGNNAVATGSNAGGALRHDYGVLIMNNTLFENNTAHDGGAIFLVFASVNANINNSKFINNFASTQGGAIYGYTSKPSIHLSNSTFINNTSPKGGAMTVYSTTADIDNCNFTDNSADVGGALWLETGSIKVRNSEFEGNTALTGDGRGGAVYHYGSNDLTLDNNSFTDNSAITGGGVYYQQASASSSIKNTNFTNNNADTGDGIYFDRYPGKLENVSLINDTIQYSNAYSTNDFNVDKYVNVTIGGVDPYADYRGISNISDNSVVVIPEDFDFSMGPITINANNVTIDGKGRTYSNANGGFLHINGDNVTVKDITFVNGTATNGGAIYWTGANGIVENSTFINNSATTNGGAIYATGKNLTIINSKFDNNSAASQGGAIRYYGAIKDFDDYTLKVFDAEFTSNTANVDGGAIYTERTAKGSIMDNVTFKDNYATSGGAIYTSYNINGYIDITDSSFINNTAKQNGAAVFCGQSYIVNITDSDFINNTGWSIIYGRNSGNLSGKVNVENSDLSGNNASSGTFVVNSPSTLTNVTITNNTGVGVSAGISGADFNNVTIANSTGTAFEVNANDVIMNGIEVSGNNGSAMVINGNYVDLKESTFVNNTGDENVGVLINGKGSTVSNSTFANNTGNSGTGIVLNGQETQISGDNTFTNNTAQYGASDIGVMPGSELTPDEYQDLIDNYPNVDVGKSPTLVFTVNSTDDTWTVRIHDDVTITINITEGNQSGKVKVTIPGLFDEQVLEAVGGIVNISLSDVPYGNYTAEIVYLEDDNYTSRLYTQVLKVREYSLNDLRQLITDAIANNKTDVSLDQNYIFQDGDSTAPIEIPDNFKINGNDHFIDAGNKSNIFKINGDNVAITNVNLTGARESAISGKGNNIKISNVNITDSVKAINLEGSDVTISDVKLDNVDDAIHVEGNGSVNIDNVNLTNVGNAVNIDSSGNTSISNMDINNVTNCPAITVKSVGDIDISNVTMNGVYGTGIEVESANGTVTITNVTNYTIIPVDPDMNVTMPTIFENETTDIPVQLPANATGNVTLIVDGEVVDTKEVINGSAILNLPPLKEGDYNITVNYTGDIYYLPQSGEFNVSVEETVVVIADDLTKYFSAPDRFIVNVTDSKGNILANKTVIITLNGNNYTRHTNENGSSSIAINLGPGEYKVLVTVDNRTFTRTITILSTVNGTDIVKFFRNGTQYYATFKDAEGNYLPNGTAVVFNINGVMYTRYIKGDEGLAKLNINLPEGEYIITASNLITGENSSNTIKVLSKLNGSDIQKYYRNGTQYTVKVLDDNGNPVGAGVKVTFNINGVFYTRQTDANGIAKLNINLPKGNYTITAEYEGCLISNNIEVLPVLFAEDLVKQQGTSRQFVATVLDDHGQPYAGQTVSFNINGVLYNRVTDGDGHAKLNINLPYGKYIITSSYNSCNIANTIIVTY